MADCFWTDLVGCVEDCGSTPAGPAGFSLWDQQSQIGGSDTQRVFLFSDTSFEAILSDACGGLTPDPDFLDVSIVQLTVYIRADADGSACNWNLAIMALHGETLDSDVGDCYSGYSWKAESFFAGTASATETATVNYAIPLDGTSEYPQLSFDDLCTLAGLPTGNNGAFKATIRNNTTGLLYDVGGVQHTCY